MSELWSFEPNASFNPSNDSSQLVTSFTVAATAVSATSTQLSGDTAIEHIRRQIRVSNTTTAWAYINFARDVSSINAATVANSYPVAPNTSTVVTVGVDVDAASVILASGTGNVTFTRGVGRT